MVAVVNQTEIVVSGDIGGIGVSRLSWVTASGGLAAPADCDVAVPAARALYEALVAQFPSAITWQVQMVVKGFDVANGGLLGEASGGTVPAPVVGTDSNPYPAGVGARGYWHTSTIFNRRLVRGALFLVPLNADCFSTTGKINTGTRGTIAAALNTYLGTMQAGSCTPVVWSRPTGPGLTDGRVSDIIAASCPTSPGGLRSRRS